MQKILQPDKPLHYQIRDNPNHQDQWMLYIDNKHISQRLEKLGCPANKTHKIIFPSWLDDSLYSHFIRGYFDGDGHIGIYNRKAQISIVGTKDFCISLQEILRTIQIDIRRFYHRHPERKNNIRSIQFRGNRQVARFLDWLYKDATIYMDRKYNRYQELLKMNRRVDARKQNA